MSDEEILAQHKMLWRDMYTGDGKDDPPMTVRLDRLEKAQENFQHYARLILGTLVTLIVALIVNAIRK